MSGEEATDGREETSESAETLQRAWPDPEALSGRSETGRSTYPSHGREAEGPTRHTRYLGPEIQGIAVPIFDSAKLKDLVVNLIRATNHALEDLGRTDREGWGARRMGSWT